MRMTLRAQGGVEKTACVEVGTTLFRRGDEVGPFWGVEIAVSEAHAHGLMRIIAEPHEAIALGHALIALGKQAMRQT